MRIAETLLVQQVDDLLVFVDESNGTEATRPLTLETVMHLIDEVAVAQIQGRSVQIDDVEIPQPAFELLLPTLGYLYGASADMGGQQ